MEGWNYISTFYFLVKNSRKYVNLCEKVAFIALKDTKGPEIWLEASTSQRAKHPRQSDKSVLKKTQWRNEHGLFLRLYGAG